MKIAERWNRNSSESGAKLVARREAPGRRKGGEDSDHRGSLKVRKGEQLFNVNGWGLNS